MIYKNIMVKLKTVLSSAYQLLLEGAYYGMLLWKMVQYFIAYQLARLFKRDLNHPTCPQDDLMNYSSGIVLAIILLFIVGIYQTDKLVNTQVKIKNGTQVNTYLRLTLPTLKVISQIRITQRYRTSINVLTSQHSMTGTMQRNQTIDVYGISLLLL